MKSNISKSGLLFHSFRQLNSAGKQLSGEPSVRCFSHVGLNTARRNGGRTEDACSTKPHDTLAATTCSEGQVVMLALLYMKKCQLNRKNWSRKLKDSLKDSYCDNSDVDSNITTMTHSRSLQGL